MGERTLVVPADAVQQAAEEDDPRQILLRSRREAVEPALKGGDLARVERALAVIAHELRRATVLSSLLEVVDRAVDVGARERALGMCAMQLDDLGRGQELACASAQELGEERLEAVAGPPGAVANDRAGLLERCEEL